MYLPDKSETPELSLTAIISYARSFQNILSGLNITKSIPCVCVYTHALEYEGCMAVRGQHWVPYSSVPPFWGRVFRSTWIILIQLSWRVNELQGSVQMMGIASWLLCECWESELRSSCLQVSFTDLTLQPQCCLLQVACNNNKRLKWAIEIEKKPLEV